MYFEARPHSCCDRNTHMIIIQIITMHIRKNVAFYLEARLGGYFAGTDRSVFD